MQIWPQGLTLERFCHEGTMLNHLETFREVKLWIQTKCNYNNYSNEYCIHMIILLISVYISVCQVLEVSDHFPVEVKLKSSGLLLQATPLLILLVQCWLSTLWACHHYVHSEHWWGSGRVAQGFLQIHSTVRRPGHVSVCSKVKLTKPQTTKSKSTQRNMEFFLYLSPVFTDYKITLQLQVKWATL